MTNEQILKKAIEKAVESGWKEWTRKGIDLHDERNYWSDMVGNCYYQEIFSHDFAKAFWGEEIYTWDLPLGRYKVHIKNFYYDDKIKKWHYHLQQMVLEEEPLKYLEKFLEKEGR